MNLNEKRFMKVFLRLLPALAMLALAFIILVQIAQHDTVGKPFGEFIFVLICLIASLVLILWAVDEIGNIFTDRFNELMVDIGQEASLFGLEEFEEGIEDEEEDEEIFKGEEFP